MFVETLLIIALFVTFAGMLLIGFHVADTLFGVSVLFTAIAMISDQYWGTAIGLDFDFFGIVIKRIYALMTNWILIAGTMFIFMGYMLDKSGIAERLLSSTQELFGNVRGGMAVTVALIGALLAASTGIIGASVVLLGVLSIPAMVAQGYSNELGWEFYLRPENDAEKIGDRIWEVGERHGMILTGTPVFRARRIEAGLMGQTEFDSTTTPFDAGLGHFVQMDKPGFIGKSALEKANKRSRTFGMRVRKGVAARGHTISVDGDIVGQVCSSTWSPFQQCGVALVRMDDPDMGPGTEVEVTGTDGTTYSAQICSLPMYDAEGAIVRGRTNETPEGPEPWEG